MTRNDIIRFSACCIGGAAWGSAVGHALEWIIVSASLGSFLTFLMWLIALALAIVGGVLIGYAVHEVLDNQRLDTGIASVRGWFSKLSTKGITAKAP
jgi:hypothetical protein